MKTQIHIHCENHIATSNLTVIMWFVLSECMACIDSYLYSHGLEITSRGNVVGFSGTNFGGASAVLWDSVSVLFSGFPAESRDSNRQEQLIWSARLCWFEQMRTKYCKTHSRTGRGITEGCTWGGTGTGTIEFPLSSSSARLACPVSRRHSRKAG